MKCCVNCFKDKEIISIITSLNKLDNCDFCNSKDALVYDILKDKELVSIFTGILDVYTEEESLPSTYSNSKKSILKDSLYNEWNLFNIRPVCIDIFIKNLLPKRYKEKPALFDEKVGIFELDDEQISTEYFLIRDNNWDGFVESIKYSNRFHSDHINLDLLGMFLSYGEEIIHENQLFYRSRVSENGEILSEKEMGAPPKGKSSSGRLNSKGISRLYLCDNKETTVREIRAGFNDTVTIATFSIEKDIKVVNLSNLKDISPILFENYIEYLVNKDSIEKISYELSKPTNKFNQDEEYLATQYISDYIESQNYDGIKFKSTMNINNYNLMLFDSEIVNFKEHEKKVVAQINYNYSE